MTEPLYIAKSAHGIFRYPRMANRHGLVAGARGKAQAEAKKMEAARAKAAAQAAREQERRLKERERLLKEQARQEELRRKEAERAAKTIRSIKFSAALPAQRVEKLRGDFLGICLEPRGGEDNG